MSFVRAVDERNALCILFAAVVLLSAICLANFCSASFFAIIGALSFATTVALLSPISSTSFSLNSGTNLQIAFGFILAFLASIIACAIASPNLDGSLSSLAAAI